MPTTAQVFYLSATDQDGSWGTDVRKLLEAAPASNATTICAHPNAAGTTLITLDPYSTSSTQGDTRDALGWALNATGADGVDSVAGALRVIPAGTWQFSNPASVPVGGTATGSLTASLLIRVFRVSAAFVRTQLFSVTTNTVASTGLAAGTGTLTASSAQPEIVLQAGETIHVGYQSQVVQVAGLVGATVAGNATYTTGAATVTLPSPGLRTINSRSSAIATAPLALLGRRTAGITRGVLSAGLAATARAVVAARSSAVQMVGLAALQRLIRLAPKSAAMAGLPAVSKRISPLPLLTVTAPVASLIKSVRKTLQAIAVGVPSAAKRVAPGPKTATAVGLAATQRALIAVRTFQVSMVGVAMLLVRIGQNVLNRLAGGATTVIRRTTNIFDD